MRHDPAAGAIVIMLRSLKMSGMAQASVNSTSRAQAGWHTTGKLVVPDNISIIALPAKCPELNPVENLSMRRCPGFC